MKFKSVLLFALTFILLCGTFYADYVFNPDTRYLSWPTNSTRVTDDFGSIRYNEDGSTRLHEGIDIGPLTPGSAGDNLYAAAAGKVVFSGNKSYAKCVYINSYRYNPFAGQNEYLQIVYKHNNINSVAKGANVTRNQVVGKMGGTFNYDVHLHFETRVVSSLDSPDDSGVARNPINSYTNFVFRMVADSNSEVIKHQMPGKEKDGVLGFEKNGHIISAKYLSENPMSQIEKYGVTKKDIIEFLATIKEYDKKSYDLIIKNLKLNK